MPTFGHLYKYETRLKRGPCIGRFTQVRAAKQNDRRVSALSEFGITCRKDFFIRSRMNARKTHSDAYDAMRLFLFGAGISHYRVRIPIRSTTWSWGHFKIDVIELRNHNNFRLLRFLITSAENIISYSVLLIQLTSTAHRTQVSTLVHLISSEPL